MQSISTLALPTDIPVRGLEKEGPYPSTIREAHRSYQAGRSNSQKKHSKKLGQLQVAILARDTGNGF